MLRISSSDQQGQPVLRLEGRLAGAAVAEAETQWSAVREMATGRPLTVDLRDVVSIDAAGRQLLAGMRRDGASFVVAGCAMRALVAELTSAADEKAGGPEGGAARAAVGKDVSGES